MFWVIIIIFIIALDQFSKLMVIRNIAFESSITIIERFFYLTHWLNKGAAWGILQNGRYLFIPLTVVVSIVIGYYLYKTESKLLRTSLTFILGGAIGNLIDRVFRGSVVDFLHFYIGSYSFPVFNIADSFVVVGTFILAYYLIFIYKEKPKEVKEDER